MFLNFVHLQHSACDNTNVNSAHDLLAVLHHDFFNHVAVDKLFDEPLGTSDVLVNVCLNISRHIRQAVFLH